VFDQGLLSKGPTQESSGRGKQQKGNDEDGSCNVVDGSGGVGSFDLDEGVDQQEFENVVVKGAEKLRDIQQMKITAEF